jgi:ribosome recycling factor
MIDDIKADARDRMGKSVESLRLDLSKLRTGRAHTSLLDQIRVPYYGAEVPLNQVANVSIQDPRTLGVTPYEKSMASVVEKAIRDSDLGLNPMTTGDLVRVPLPALTEDRRKEMVRIVRNEAESARVAIRNIRRDANHSLKELVKEKEISEDDERRAEDEVQKLTNSFIGQIDKLLEGKEAELMEV